MVKNKLIRLILICCIIFCSGCQSNQVSQYTLDKLGAKSIEVEEKNLEIIELNHEIKQLEKRIVEIEVLNNRIKDLQRENEELIETGIYEREAYDIAVNVLRNNLDYTFKYLDENFCIPYFQSNDLENDKDKFDIVIEWFEQNKINKEEQIVLLGPITESDVEHKLIVEAIIYKVFSYEDNPESVIGYSPLHFVMFKLIENNGCWVVDEYISEF